MSRVWFAQKTGTKAWLNILAMLWIAANHAGSLDAQYSLLGEYQVKAAFLYNFVKFVEWPPDSFADPNSPLILSVLGDDPFGETLDRAVTGKSVQGRPLVVKRWKQLENSLHCHILFVSASERNSLPEILKKVQGASVLTVGDTEGFAQRGVIVNFTINENKVRFEINNLSAKRSRLRVSSKLLTLAASVWE